MVPLTELWLPILLSAVLVFFVSAIFNTVLPHHRNDFRSVPPESGIRESLLLADLPPGQYAIPRPESRSDLASPEFRQMMEEGPVVHLRVRRSGLPKMGGALTAWFLASLFISALAAYVAGAAVGPGGEYRDVFRFTSTTAAAAYIIGGWQESIWYAKPWLNTIRGSIDGFVYALLTAGVFGWLWP